MSDHARLPADTCNDKKAGPVSKRLQVLGETSVEAEGGEPSRFLEDIV
jgi:hypothetical protein